MDAAAVFYMDGSGWIWGQYLYNGQTLNPQPNPVYFQAVDCSGQLYIVAPGYSTQFPVVFRGKAYYQAGYNPSRVTFASQMSSAGVCTNGLVAADTIPLTLLGDAPPSPTLPILVE